MHADGEYDLAGFAVGVVSKKGLLGPARVRSDDVLIAVASSGIHSNGYSLVRRIFEADWGSLDRRVDELGETLGEALLRPTKIYASAVTALSRALGNDLHALCHVTGGGIVGNLPRVLPEGATALVSLPRPWPPIFELIARRGPVAEAEMHRTFNLGVGLIAAVARERAADAISALSSSGEKAWELGVIRPAAEGVPASAQIVAGSLP
jgi:phosphoribosylformylglycinamidine cyclo-ligase